MQIISPLNIENLRQFQSKIDNKTKPLGSLGVLEPLALQLALITHQRLTTPVTANKQEGVNSVKISLNKPSMLIFAGDHGINEEGLSIAPSAVTKQMVLNFLHGGAAINCFCQSNDIDLTVIDAGILEPVYPDELPLKQEQNNVSLMVQRLGAGTQNFAKKPAMKIAQLEQGFEESKQLVARQIKQGTDVLLLGEMGIANTSSAAALMAALTGFSVNECVGRGTGISDEQLTKKITLIEQALERISLPDGGSTNFSKDEVLNILTELGGFEIVQMVSAILTAAAKSIPVVIDGFIVSVAALVALRLDKNVANYLIFSHISQEQAHQMLLTELLSAQTLFNEPTQPLLNLGLRLGEGTGGALALPLIKSAASFYNNMASFESAGVTV